MNRHRTPDIRTKFQSSAADEILSSRQDFSLVLGGPVYQLLRRAHLSDDALHLLRQRLVVISLFAWLPLLALCALEGNLYGGKETVPFGGADENLDYLEVVHVFVRGSYQSGQVIFQVRREDGNGRS